MAMDADKTISRVVDRLINIAGIEALVLGGSRARGTHNEKSDVDLGIYYDPSVGLDLDELGRAAQELDDAHRESLITPIGGWGPWINGGGWLTVDGVAVDFLYRDLDRVSGVIGDCRDGRITVAYQAGHPHAFTSAIYCAEVALCRPLWDLNGSVARLKRQTLPYPSGLKRAIINTFWWEVDFSLQIAKKSIARGDSAYAAGCCFRCVACLMQTLFAVNETHWMNEKGAVSIAAGFQMAPPNIDDRIDAIFTRLDASQEGIAETIDRLQALVTECAPWVEKAR